MTDAAQRIIELYETFAAHWDAGRGKTLGEKPWLDRFTDGLQAGAAVLDIGCGSGEPIAAYFTASGFHVTGIDSSAPLIDLCSARFPGHQWHVSDMRKLSLGQRFDGLIAWDSFFHLTYDDQRAMFPIFRDHAAPGARLMFTSGPAHGEAIGSFEGEELYHASLAPEEYRQLLQDNGFAVMAHVAEDPTCGGHTIWLARFGE
ncbi:class I SAM-dependent methyltransferase [Rhizobium sp. KVB221]|uniref:Class I SAM-dependent methyltransferase n=1 Tax=Rhizobium setariae TaxID=2801340 RepID=A0A936YHV5_9HYPH|nr:class I SAM-dependent methyltransferase [Rhizobium setariae]MBL0370450.1 class I SAM-dependent methyltransferase [Rhizobium setariae]